VVVRGSGDGEGDEDGEEEEWRVVKLSFDQAQSFAAVRRLDMEVRNYF
jgi:hypothetical protein